MAVSEFEIGVISTLYTCFQMIITSLCQLQFVHCLKCWTSNFLSFETIYRMPKMDFIKYSKFCLKSKVHVATIFSIPNFHANFMNLFHASLFMFGCLLSSYIMINAHFPNSWHPRFAFPQIPWDLTCSISHLTIWSFKI